ncbi:MAG: hypothetical protein AAGB22_03540 [Bacteroidota bacterium]
MNLAYKIGQLRNLLFRGKHRHAAARWVFIYGQPRSGTTYVMQQFLRISRGGFGDWELKEFADPIRQARERDWVSLDTDRLVSDLRNNLFATADIGSGSRFDMAVKQITTTKNEFDFLCELMGSEPEHRLFLYREPDGWLASAYEKFGFSEAEALEVFRQGFASWEAIGGQRACYGPEITALLESLGVFEGVSLTGFNPKRAEAPKAPEAFHALYSAFVRSPE